MDFASIDPMLVIEIDDTSHDFRDETYRTAFLEARGFTILRFSNREIAMDVASAFSTVERWVQVMKETGRPPT